jgi:hypothetical protein
MTENLAQFTLVAGFASLVSWVLRPRRWLVLAAAVAFAASSLTRPIYQVLTPALGAGLLCAAALTGWRPASRRQALMAAAALVMVSGLLLAGYAGANRLRFGFFGVTHTAGFHLSTRTMAFVERLPDEHAAVREILVRERDAQLTKRGGTHTGTQAIWSVREELSAATGLDMPQLSRFLLAMNLRLIADAPLEYAGEVRPRPLPAADRVTAGTTAAVPQALPLLGQRWIGREPGRRFLGRERGRQGQGQRRSNHE